MTWFNTNAWREVLSRVFDGFSVEHDVSPEWLVNPDTNRRLKLDLLYPQVGIAIRFHGLRGREQRQRSSLQEEELQKVRDIARADLCAAHGIRLVAIDVASGAPRAIVRELSTALSDASRQIVKSDQPEHNRNTLKSEVSQARSRLDDLARRLRRTEDLKLYAELWEDRQYAELPQSESSSSNPQSRAYKPGMAVHHVMFGEGIVQAVHSEGDDSLVTVRFAQGGQKIFAASLVSDKMIPHR